MPQLFSRMDNANWVTPSISDILDQGAAPPGGDGSIRERMLMIQQELTDLETPARIVNVRSMPSYTLYVARPETVGRMGNRHTITPAELRRSVGQIAEVHKDWMLGFLPQLQDTEDAVGILLRTEEHRPQSLRRLLVRSTFRNYESSFAFTLGITLEQQLIVSDIVEIANLLIVGTNKAKQHFIRSTVLTLMLLNTPGELRLAFTGEGSDAYKTLLGTPHALGRLLTSPDDAQRLLDGLIKEVQRRQQMFAEENVEKLAEYNVAVREKGKAEFPRILLLIDSLSDPEWRKSSSKWGPALTELLAKGPDMGIHMIIAIGDMDDNDVPELIKHAIPTKIILRSVASGFSENLENFHPSLLRFIDAFVVNDDAQEKEIIPVELCSISNQEIQSTINYWLEASKQRFKDTQLTQTTKTGMTEILSPAAEAMAEIPAPPVPEKPSAAAITRATQMLASIQATRTSTIPQHNGSKLPPPEETPTLLKQAQALAAYLGWLGVGPLHDILLLAPEDAATIVRELQAMGVLENIDTPTPRFLRLLQSQPDPYT